MSVSISEDQGQEPQPQAPLPNPEPDAAEQPVATVEPVASAQPVAEPVVMERPAPEPLTIPVAEQAPLITIAKPEPLPEPQPHTKPQATTEAKVTQPSQLKDQSSTPAAAAEGSSPVLGLPLQLVNQLLARLGAAPLSSLADLLPAVRIISLLVVAGIAVKLTGATLGAINELPLLGRLLELAGLISALNFLARNAIRSQKRAELLARIQTLKRNLLG